VVGSRGSPELTAIRAWMAIDWLIHIWTPAWLELACYTEAAETIAAFPALTSAATAFPPYEFFEQLYDEHKNRWRYEIRPGLHEAVLGRALRLTGIGGMEEVFMEVMMEDPVRYFGDGDGGELWWPPLIRMAIGIGRNCALAVAGAAAAGEARPREAIQRVLLPTARELQASFITLLGQMTTRREGPSARIPTIDMA